MALSQKGANYDGRESIANPPASLRELSRHLVSAFDDISSQVQAIRAQGNFGQSGSPSAPHTLSAIAVLNSGGFAQVALTHNDAPAGVKYIIQYSTTPNFQNPQVIDNGESLTHERYLHGQTLYFRAAPKYPASPLAQWIYFGGQARPTAVTF